MMTMNIMYTSNKPKQYFLGDCDSLCKKAAGGKCAIVFDCEKKCAVVEVGTNFRHFLRSWLRLKLMA